MCRVPRNGADARRRLQGAALELWIDRGYDATTAADIAVRAGLTERTFFRHFPDKREVLFDGAAAMRELMTGALANTPASLTPFATLKRAFSAAEPLLGANRPYAAARQRIIAQTPALRERELAKRALLASTLAETLALRGLEPRLAALAAEAGMAAFEHAFAAWINHPDLSLDTHLEEAFDHLSEFSTGWRGRSEVCN